MKMVHFNSPDNLFISRENKTALVINIAVSLAHNLFNTEAKKMTKYENLAMEIRSIWKLNNMYKPCSHLSGRSGHQKLYKILYLPECNMTLI
jgi:hypothetical protein